MEKRKIAELKIYSKSKYNITSERNDKGQNIITILVLSTGETFSFEDISEAKDELMNLVSRRYHYWFSDAELLWDDAKVTTKQNLSHDNLYSDIELKVFSNKEKIYEITYSDFRTNMGTDNAMSLRKRFERYLSEAMEWVS